MSTGLAFLQNVFQFIRVLTGKEAKRIYWTAALFGFICMGISGADFWKNKDSSGSDSFEEHEWFAEENLQNKPEVSESDQRQVSDILKQNTIPSLEMERAVRERVFEAQKEVCTPEREESVKQADFPFPCSEQDYQVMLKIVQAEAGGCDRKGKILVANVVMNRVKSDEFPDSITSVVYEGSQFSPVIDGSIDQVKISEDTIQCVNQALSGEDYSQGALYFMNRRASRSKNVTWFDQRLTYLFQHESHEFFK